MFIFSNVNKLAFGHNVGLGSLANRGGYGKI